MSISKIDTRRKVEQLQDEIQRRDVKLRQLQASLEAALADKEQFESELTRVLTISDAPTAGRKQVNIMLSPPSSLLISSFSYLLAICSLSLLSLPLSFLMACLFLPFYQHLLSLIVVLRPLLFRL